jgi:glyoxylase-like metal-dependent hydrolase (beta-lactamase superfamily II)
MTARAVRPPTRPAEVTEVAPGILRLAFPLPFQLDHINLWALADAGGWTLVDCGLGNAHSQAEWRRLFAAELGGRPVRRILVTHHHPDHFGLGGWLVAETGAPLAIAAKEMAQAVWLMAQDHDSVRERAAAWYRDNGVSAEQAARASARGNDYVNRMLPLPATVETLRPGQTLSIGGHAWQLLLGEGHSPEHLSLWCPDLDLLIAGDQVLPKISPNVSAYWFEAASDPLTRFLATIERFRALPADTTVLPSHGPLFQGLHERLDALAAHHVARLAEAAAACGDSPRQAAEILPLLFKRPLDDHQIFFALGEAAAHLNCLVARGTLRREAGEGGVWYRRP